MENNFSDIQRGADKLLDGITEKVKQLDIKIGELNANVVKLLSTPANSSGLTTQVKTLETEITKLNTTIGKQQTQIKELTSVKDAYNKSSEKETSDIKSKIPTLNQMTKANKSLSDAYTVLLNKQKQAKDTLRSLIVEQGKNSIETKKAQKEYDRLTKKVNQANKATSNFSKTGLGGMVRGFKNLIGAFGVVAGASLFANMVKNIFNLTKKLESLDFALKAVVKNQNEFARTQAFLSEISSKYGANILTTTERYTKFLAAAKQSNVALQDTEDIFRTVTKASGVLGLKTDELTGIYLALEQMLSKGKVTTEELRRQLGERLPGAFGIMAEAVGVSVVELDKMLRAGEILSSDALPKFAKQLEIAYGIQNVDKIETLAAAQVRMQNSWVEFVRSLQFGQGILSNVFKGLVSVASGFLDLLTKINKSSNTLTDQVIREQRALNNLINTITDSNTSNEKREVLLKKLKKEYPFFLQQIKDEETNNKNLSTALKEVNELYIKRIALQSQQDVINELLEKSGNEALRLAKAQIKASEEASKINIDQKLGLDLTNKSYDERIILVKTVLEAEAEYQTIASAGVRNAINPQAKALDRLNKITGTGVTTTMRKNKVDRELNEEQKLFLQLQKNLGVTLDEINKLFGVGTEETVKNTKATVSNGDAKEKVEKINKNSEKAFEKQISVLKELRSNVEVGTAQWELYDKMINVLQYSLDGLTGKLKSVETEEIDFNIFSEEEQKEALKKLEESGKLIKDFFKGFQDEFFSDVGFEKLNEFFLTFDEHGNSLFDNLLKNADEGFEKFAVYFDAISEVAQEAFNFINQQSQASFDAEFERLEKQRDIALQFAGESTAAQEQIQEQYEARRKAIQQRQARSQKQQAIVNTIFNTAQAVVATLAQTPPPAGLPLAAIVAGIGAAQLALIASTPLPEFFRGTQNAPEGWALVDEKQPEVHTDRHGNVKSMGENKANHRYLSAGDKIYKSHEEWINKEFKDVIHGNDIITYNEAMSQAPTVVVKDNGFTASQMDSIIAKHFSNIKTQNTIIDKNGVQTYISKGNSRTIELNNRVSFKGISV